MFETLKTHKTFEGTTIFCEHDSNSTKTKMKFSAFLPVEVSKVENAIIWLSGLTCTEENFITKAGAQKFLQGTKTMIICPDTSPRGLGLPGEDESYDFGTGAGFYVDSTEKPFDQNYQMDSYITKDIVKLLKEEFKVKNISISGHSMGGHGALALGLRNPSLFKSISAFSPIVNPTQCPWGEKAFKGYLGSDESAWKKYDACELLRSGSKSSSTILIDQGTADEFLEEQLLSDNFKNSAAEVGQSFELNYREGYDHSYYFISSFIGDHIKHHLQYLNVN